MTTERMSSDEPPTCGDLWEMHAPRCEAIRGELSNWTYCDCTATAPERTPWPPIFGMPLVERTDLRRGLVYKMGQMLVVGTMPPTPIQQQVMDGVAAAHPWFRDPMRVDVMAALRGLS